MLPHQVQEIANEGLGRSGSVLANASHVQYNSRDMTTDASSRHTMTDTVEAEVATGIGTW